MRRAKIDFSQLILIGYLLLSYLIIYAVGANTYNYFINPIFWISMAAYTLYVDGIYARFSNKNENIKLVIVMTLFYLIIYFLSGLLFGYAYSPYSHAIKTLLLNIWRFIVPIVCIEIVRSVIINKNKKNKTFIIIATILFILLEFNFKAFMSSTRDYGELFKNIGSSLLPLIAENIMLTYFTLCGSYNLALTYRLPVELTFLILPIFPNFDWYLTGVIGITVPIVFIIIFSNFKSIYGTRKRKGRKKESLVSMIPFLIVLSLLVLFMCGIFRYEPLAIMSNSMVPLFEKGDLVIFEKIPDEELKKIEIDTIIVYSIKNQLVIHRIVDRWESEGETYYLTKGDANMTNDIEPVKPNQIIGIYKFHIKYLGYPSVILSELFNKKEAVVETG